MWRITDSPMWSLGVFTPDTSRGKGAVWGQWSDFIRSRIKNSSYQLEVRHPEHYWSLLSANDGGYGRADCWHRDGDSDFVEDLPEYLAMWSNGIGTEIKVVSADGRIDLSPTPETICQAPPGEVLLIDNHLMMHRSPPWKRARIDVSNRWFARALCSSKCFIYDVPGIFALEL